jgi:hypothetical protein
MTTLHIYNSQGERLGDGPASNSGRVEDFFFDGVRLYLDMSDEPEIVLFFRARDSEASRAEQYYAIYQTDTSTGLFERLERDLRAEIEDEREMLLETESDDTQLVSLLTAETAVPGTDDQHGAISSLLAEQTPLRLRVTTESAAFGLLRRYIGSPTEEFAIVDDTTTDSVTDCGLAIEPGGDTELEPLGESADQFEEQLRRTTANAARPRTTEPVETIEETDRVPLETIGKEVLAVSLGILLTTVLLVALLNGAAVIGLEFPGTDWLIFI